MKRLILIFVIVLLAISTYSQVRDTTKTAKYQCLTISYIMDNKIAEIRLDDGIKNRSIGVKKEDGTFFTSNNEVLNYVCLKNKLELVAVTEMNNVYKFYLVKR